MIKKLTFAAAFAFAALSVNAAPVETNVTTTDNQAAVVTTNEDTDKSTIKIGDNLYQCTITLSDNDAVITYDNGKTVTITGGASKFSAFTAAGGSSTSTGGQGAPAIVGGATSGGNGGGGSAATTL